MSIDWDRINEPSASGTMTRREYERARMEERVRLGLAATPTDVGGRWWRHHHREGVTERVESAESREPG